MTSLVWDYDYIKYSVGSVSEKRTINVTNATLGVEQTFKTRTEFFGHHAKKAGGWLAEFNKGREFSYDAEEFTILDIQTADPLENCLNMVNTHIQGVINKTQATSYYGYIGKGDSWRVEASTILRYKGARANALKPLHLANIEEYLVKHHGAQFVTHYEADDIVVMDCTKDPELVLVGVDKDYNSCSLNLFNPDKMQEPIKISGLGSLYLDDKKVRGTGRMFLYHQVLSGDASDGYYANSASEIKWADKSSYSLLSKCSDDKLALQAVVEGYKKLYPAPKEIMGWRGDKITVDFMYVMQENFTMAHMLRHKNDFINVPELLDKLGVSY